jgi:hypothetical protein
MKRFEEFEIELINLRDLQQMEDLALPNEPEVTAAKVKIDMNSVIAFREATLDSDDPSKLNATSVYLDSGESFCVRMPYKEFSKLL